jgi:hypothetical protein
MDTSVVHLPLDCSTIMRASMLKRPEYLSNGNIFLIEASRQM